MIDLLARSPIDELEIEESGWKIRLTRGTGSAAMTSPVTQLTPSETTPRKATDTAAVPQPVEQVIPSPTYGVFHISSSPGTPAYVKIGDVVEAGQQVGLVEAMKVFNAVKAPQSGRITEILVEDGAEVEAGTPLFRLA
ncbi:acetyl-CoA carboxylase biotin carboxyl carrier protein [Acetobacter aceti]|uniref:acetyl-CoA carboxylase biotin carboxyl carrier protein n=1 Tax=Acetobacter aceti TaxID=435 RepID=UPI001E4A9383|nr:acetyl-CoA carboxylase biotin carboxyl carrier protein subunit [Acetobacter aceti]